MQTINLSLSMPNVFNDLITNRLQCNSTKKNFCPEYRSIFPQQISIEAVNGRSFKLDPFKNVLGYLWQSTVGKHDKGGVKQDRSFLCRVLAKDNLSQSWSQLVSSFELIKFFWEISKTMPCQNKFVLSALLKESNLKLMCSNIYYIDIFNLYVAGLSFCCFPPAFFTVSLKQQK